MTTPKSASTNSGAGLPNTPRRVRLRLDTIDRVRRETARLYLEGKLGQRDPSDVSKLGSLLALIGRLIEGGEMERRIEALEQAERR